MSVINYLIDEVGFNLHDVHLIFEYEFQIIFTCSKLIMPSTKPLLIMLVQKAKEKKKHFDSEQLQTNTDLEVIHATEKMKPVEWFILWQYLWV